MLGINQRWELQTDVKLLAKIRVAKPERIGSQWKGVAHHRMVTALITSLEDRGLELANPRFFLSRSNADIAFSCNVFMPEVGSMQLEDQGKCYTLIQSFGFAASNARRRGLAFYAGYSCQQADLKFIGTKWLGGKYTLNFNPEEEMENAVETFHQRIGMVKEMLANAALTKVGENRVRMLLMEAGARNLMPWSRIGRVADAMMQETGLLNHLFMEFGKITSMNPPPEQLDQLYGFTELVLELYPELGGVVPAVFALK